MIRLLFLIILIVFISGCASKYDYSIHKPRVRFKPSIKALNRLNYETKGHRYVWGAENDGCYDCSGLTYYTYGSMGIEIPRVAREQFRVGTPIPKSELKKGDLVFFNTSRRKRGVPTHVGIYLGNGKFQHASSSKKRVIISSLDEPYFKRRYLGARRIYSFNDYPKYKPTYIVKTTQPTKTIATSRYNQYTTSNQLFSQIQKEINSNSNNYYILIHSSPNRANEIVTKLELSGLPSSITQEGRTILVGPFSSKSEALKIKNFNSKLLANATIRSI